MINKYTIDELANLVNSKLDNSLSSDNRLSKELSTRRIKDYLSKKLISPPIPDGKTKFYTDEHVQQLLSLRNLQLQGISENYIKSQTTATNNYIEKNVDFFAKSNLENNQSTLDFLNTLKNQSSFKSSFRTVEENNKIKAQAQIHRSSKDYQSQHLMSTSSISKSASMPKDLYFLSQSKSKSYTEYSLDKDESIFIKFDSKISLEKQHELYVELKKVINNHTNKGE